MNFSFHNKLTIQLSNKNYTYYNTMLNSTLFSLSNYEKFNEYISVGNGDASSAQSSFHLTNFLCSGKLNFCSFQSDIGKGNIFAIYEFKLLRNNIKSDYITEIGLSNNDENPIIYNYFSLTSEDMPNGLDISEENEIVFKITINLNITETTNNILTSGSNPFIEFLLGNGLGEVKACLGSNFSENVRISRVKPITNNLKICTKNANLSENMLNLSFSCDFNKEIDEIVYMANDKVFARQNLKEYKNQLTKNNTFSPKSNYVIKIDNDIKSIDLITNNSTSSTETNCVISKYANSIGDEITSPFENLFNHETTKFVSKDGKLIFFILNNKVYCYKNENFEIMQLNTRAINDDEITKIIAFDNYIFVVSKISPYISTYIIADDLVKKVDNDIEKFEKFSELETLRDIDITLCNNGNFIIGLLTQNGNGLSIYLTYSAQSGFTVTSYLINSRVFNYVFAMLKNNFCDGSMFYLKEGEFSYECRIVTHSSSATETDIYSYLAYALSLNAKRVYCKGRAIISEKNTSPSIVIYYYPQIYQYELPLIQEEVKDFISDDLYYIAQEYDNKEFKIYNLIGYDTPEEFTNNLSDFMDCNLIQEIVFLKDSFLVFTNNKNETIRIFNLKLNKSQIENVSDKDATYQVSYKEYDKLGSNGESVTINFKTGVHL